MNPDCRCSVNWFDQHLYRKIVIADGTLDACAQGIDVPNTVYDEAVVHNLKYIRHKSFREGISPRANDDKWPFLKSGALSSP